METCEVVVVGSGPTGLMLACELKLAGIDVVVLEKNPGRHGETRAVHMQPRAAEEMRLRGLFDGVNERAIANLDSGYLAGVPVPLDYTTWPTRSPSMIRILQPQVEEMLENRLTELGGAVRYRHAAAGIDQDADGVVTDVESPDGTYQLRSAYLVGCDGGQSKVRKLAGVNFPGTDPSMWGVVGDIRLSKVPDEIANPGRAGVDIYGKLKPGAPFVMLVALGKSGKFRCAWVDPDPAAKPASSDAPVTIEEYQAVLAGRYDGDVEIEEVIWSGRYTDASRQAERYQSGRVFLAGDAAHIHLPASSQGMGLGLQDAMNLGWKLASRVQGYAPAAVLGTYHTERHAAARRILENIKVQGLLSMPTVLPEVPAVRDLLVALLAIPDVNHYLSGLISNFDIRHPVEGYQEGVSHDLLGARLPDAEVTVREPGGPRRRWFSDLFHQGHMVLLATPGAAQHAAVAGPWAERIDVVEVAGELPVPGRAADALLVRPDGYVCWAAPGSGSLADALCTWLGPGKLQAERA